MITRQEKKKAIEDFKNIIEEYRKKGILFLCQVDDVKLDEKEECHYLHAYQIIDIYKED